MLTLSASVCAIVRAAADAGEAAPATELEEEEGDEDADGDEDEQTTENPETKKPKKDKKKPVVKPVVKADRGEKRSFFLVLLMMLCFSSTILLMKSDHFSRQAREKCKENSKPYHFWRSQAHCFLRAHRSDRRMEALL